MSDSIVYRKDVVEALYEALRTQLQGVFTDSMSLAISMANELPSAEPEPHEINYTDCANAMLKMWIDNVLTDSEYDHIMDKLNTYWAKRRTDERFN